MDKLLEMLNRIEEFESQFKKSTFSPRLVVDLDGAILVGFRVKDEKRNNIYSDNVPIGNIRDGDEILAQKLEKWAIYFYRGELINKNA